MQGLISNGNVTAFGGGLAVLERPRLGQTYKSRVNQAAHSLRAKTLQ
jgi:hypothetical protein